MKTKTYIYELSIDNIPFYIGKTVNPKQREKKHIIERKNPNIVLTVIDEIIGDVKQWKPLESYWISQYQQWGFELKNKNKGGAGRVVFLTEEDYKKKRKEWRENNKERFVNSVKRNHEQNKEKLKLYDKSRYQLNKKQRQKQSLEYYYANREKIRERENIRRKKNQ